MLQSEQTDKQTNRQPAIERDRQKVAMNMSHILNHNLLHNLSAAQVTTAGTMWLMHPGRSLLSTCSTRLAVFVDWKRRPLQRPGRTVSPALSHWCSLGGIMKQHSLSQRPTAIVSRLSPSGTKTRTFRCGQWPRWLSECPHRATPIPPSPSCLKLQVSGWWLVDLNVHLFFFFFCRVKGADGCCVWLSNRDPMGQGGKEWAVSGGCPLPVVKAWDCSACGEPESEPPCPRALTRDVSVSPWMNMQRPAEEKPISGLDGAWRC